MMKTNGKSGGNVVDKKSYDSGSRSAKGPQATGKGKSEISSHAKPKGKSGGK